MKVCLLDRNEEIFNYLEKACAPGDSSTSKSISFCERGNLSSGDDYLSLNSYIDGFSSIKIEAFRSKNSNVPYFPASVSFAVYYDDVCSMEDTLIISGLRACENDQGPSSNYIKVRLDNTVSKIDLFRAAILRFLNLQVSTWPASDEYFTSEMSAIEGLNELLDIERAKQQTYPTALIREIAKSIDFGASIEDIMSEYQKYMRSTFASYFSTPFAKRAIYHAESLVCRRTAHEIFATKYFFGCGDFAATFIALLNAGGINARLVKAVNRQFSSMKDYGHDFVEIYDNVENKWVLTDPTSGHIYRTYNGELQFATEGSEWIRMGEWRNSWESGCHTVSDLTTMRAKAIKDRYQPDLPFTRIDKTN